jgi:hypothetical protein
LKSHGVRLVFAGLFARVQTIGDLAAAESFSMRLLDYGPQAKEKAKSMLREIRLKQGTDRREPRSATPSPRRGASGGRGSDGSDGSDIEPDTPEF